jgi:uncharacterized protein YtpQ (UPF0354 family)
MNDSDIIYPYLKRIYPAGDQAIELEGGNELVSRPFNDHAIITYLIDRGETYSFVQQRHLVSHGITSDELHHRSLDNYRKLPIRIEDRSSLKVVLVNGNLESTLLLIDGFWDLIRDDVKGNVIVACPSRDVLAIGGSLDSNAIKLLSGVIERVLPLGDHVLFPYILERTRAGAWSKVARAP